MIKLPLLPTVIAGSAIAGTVTGLVIEGLTTPKQEAKVEANQGWHAKLDEFLAKNPVPEGTNLMTHNPAPYTPTILIGLGGAAVGAGAGVALKMGAAATPIGRAIALGALALGVGGIAGAAIGYYAIK